MMESAQEDNVDRHHKIVCDDSIILNEGQNTSVSSGQGISSCKQCIMTFTDELRLHNHMCSHRGDDDTSVKTVLDEELTRSKHTKTYRQLPQSRQCQQNAHSNVDRWISEIVCDKEFSSKSEPTTEMNICRSEKLLKCSVCGKQFSFKSDLLIHMRHHTGEKPFRCSTCGKEFSYKGHLNTHMKTHTGEKPYMCSVCGKTFSQRSNLRRHARIHYGDNI